MSFIKKLILLLLIFTINSQFSQKTNNKIFNQKTNCNAETLEDFFNCYGGQNTFQQIYIDAISAMIKAEDLVKEGNYAQAKTELDNLWAKHPVADVKWYNSKIDDNKNKTNVGDIAAYSSLRMLTDIVNYKINNPNPPSEVFTAILRVVLIGCSEGIRPSNQTELTNNTGSYKKNTLDSRLKDDNYKVIKESLELFLRYVNVITKGKLDVKIEFHDLPNFCGKTRYSSNGPRADIDNPSEAVNSISKELRQQTDWWWVIYPSAVPEDGINGIANNAGFDDNYAFITGGMGAISNNKPMFIVNDRWIVRRPPHLGRGDYTSIERRAYLPNWFQHEFYHHLYRSYPDLGLEPSGHDWHNRAFWPSDFNGSFEADFYYESFHKRLKDVKPHLNYILNPTYKPSNEILNSLDLSQFLNQTFDASEDIIKSGGTPNDWHVGKIILQNGKYYWRNNGNAQWEVVPNFANAAFTTKQDNPYIGQDFFITFKRDDTGKYINGIDGLYFNGSLYKRTTSLSTDNISKKIDFTISPNPSKNFLKINGLTIKSNYLIYNILGVKLTTGKISNNEKIDIKNLSKGIYFIEIEKGNTLKFIKE